MYKCLSCKLFHFSLSLYIYIYMYRERERERDVCVYSMCMCVCIYIYIYLFVNVETRIRNSQARISVALVVSMSRRRCPYFRVGSRVRDSGLQKRVFISPAGCTRLAYVYWHWTWGGTGAVRQGPHAAWVFISQTPVVLFENIEFDETLHPVSVRRFPSFRTQPLENLSHYLWTNDFWATQPLAKIF